MFNYMAMAGWKTEDMLGGIEGVMNLAAASGEELGTVSDIVTDAMTAFGLSASETSKVLKDGMEVEVPNTTRFVDALAAASNSSNTNVAMLGESFKYVAPIAGSLGYSVEDTAIALGLMANNGIKASSAGTALRNILTNMANPTEKMAAAMDTLGVSLEDSEGNVKPLMDVMKDLRKGFSGGQIDADKFAEAMTGLQNDLDEGKISQEAYNKSVEGWIQQMYGAEGAQKAQLAASLAGKFGMAGLLAIVNTTEEDFNSLSDAIYNASGTSEEMAEIMLDNLPGAITLAKSALEGLGIKIGEVLTPSLTKIIGKFTDFISWLTKANDGTVKFAVVFGVILAAIGPVLLMLGTMTRQVLTLMEAYNKLSKVLEGKTVAGILRVAKAKLVDAAATVKDTIANSAFGKSMSSLIAPVKAAIGRVLALAAAHRAASLAAFGVIGGIVALALYMKKTGMSLDEVTAKFTKFLNGIANKIPQMASKISVMIGKIAEQLPTIITNILSSFTTIISENLPTILESLQTIITAFVNAISTNAPAIVEAAAKIAIGLATGILKALPDILVAVGRIAIAIVKAFGTIGSALVKAGIQLMKQLWNGIKSWAGKLKSNVKSTAKQIPQAIKSGIGSLLTIGKNWIQSLWNGIKARVGSIKSSVTAFAKSIPTAIKSGLGSLYNIGANFIQGLLNGLQSKWNGITKWFKDKASALPNWLKKAWGIHSPSRVAMSIGRYFMQGLQVGMENGFKPLINTMRTQADEMLDAYKPFQNYNFEIGDSLDKRMLGSLDGLSVNMANTSREAPVITNNITVDGAQNPEDFAQRFTRQLKMDMRTI